MPACISQHQTLILKNLLDVLANYSDGFAYIQELILTKTAEIVLLLRSSPLCITSQSFSIEVGKLLGEDMLVEEGNGSGPGKNDGRAKLLGLKTMDGFHRERLGEIIRNAIGVPPEGMTGVSNYQIDI